MELDVCVALRQLRRLDIHRDIRVLFRVSRSEYLSIRRLIDEKKLAAEDSISAFEQIVLTIEVLFELTKSYSTRPHSAYKRREMRVGRFLWGIHRWRSLILDFYHVFYNYL